MAKGSQITLTELDIDQMPTSPSTLKACVVAFATLAVSGLAFPVYLYGNEILDSFLSNKSGVEILWKELKIYEAFEISFGAIGGLGLLCLAAGTLGLILRSRATLMLLKSSQWLITFVMVAFSVLCWHAAFSISNANSEDIGVELARLDAFKQWWDWSGAAIGIAVYAIWLKMMLSSQQVVSVFTRLEGDALAGDVTLENIRTHGNDKRHRKALYWSVFTHFFFIILLPWLLGLFDGSVEAYRVPKGSGNPVVTMVKMVKPKKKPKKKLTLRPNSAIIYDQPDLDETEVDQVMEKQTQLTYQAALMANAGNLGRGGGKDGGWPNGALDSKVRFIRLDHGGQGWDDGMDKSGADVAFLKFFRDNTPFKKISNKGESHKISLLKKYPDDGFPPFVYMTGNGNMGRVSSADAKILREYCLKGGMLVADAGSASFHRSFTHFIRQVFPDKPLIDIADDDMIFQLPYSFPNGAPPLWAHGGRRALGIKHEGRWVCFYHPGDMNDAWKAQGYTDVDPQTREVALSLGLNITYYAFNQWDDAISKIRRNQKKGK